MMKPEPWKKVEALYNAASADFSKGNYALAVSGFQEYQERFADSALADSLVTDSPFLSRYIPYRENIAFDQDDVPTIQALMDSARVNEKLTTAASMLDKHPERVIEKAVFGMLPKGTLGKQVLRKKLKVYAGPEHPHQGQNPTPVDLR